MNNFDEGFEKCDGRAAFEAKQKNQNECKA